MLIARTDHGDIVLSWCTHRPCHVSPLVGWLLSWPVIHHDVASATNQCLLLASRILIARCASLPFIAISQNKQCSDQSATGMTNSVHHAHDARFLARKMLSLGQRRPCALCCPRTDHSQCWRCCCWPSSPAHACMLKEHSLTELRTCSISRQIGPKRACSCADCL